jgi:hypothetical protein
MSSLFEFNRGKTMKKSSSNNNSAYTSGWRCIS